MKCKIKILIVVTAIVSVFIFTKKENKSILQDLTFNNVEALANGEGGFSLCIGAGSIDCGSDKVDIKITGLR